jgi:outer membrane protein assembly factor BamD (BamD/ComL family)
MSYRIKIAPKSLGPDEAQLRSGMERVLDFMQDYRRAIGLAVAILLIVVAILLGLGWYDHRQRTQALELERQAAKLYRDRPIDQPARAETNLKLAIELYRRIVDEYPRAPVTPLVLYQLGNALVQANDTAGAIDAYKRYVMAYGNNKLMLGLIYQRLGYAYLLHGNREQATNAFSAVLEIPGALNKDQVLFELGKSEETLSRPEGALARYQELMKAYANSPFASEAAVRIKALEVKKIPPEPAAPTDAGSTSPTSSASPAPPMVKPGQAPLPQGGPQGGKN